jgi:hypothetical protein
MANDLLETAYRQAEKAVPSVRAAALPVLCIEGDSVYFSLLTEHARRQGDSEICLAAG